MITTIDTLLERPSGEPPRVVKDVADWVVVGTGAGGAVVARILAEAGADLVLIEEGPPVDRARTARSMWDSAKLLFREAMSQGVIGRSFIPLIQGRCVGGGTAINSAIVWRIPEKGYARAFGAFGLADAITSYALDEAYALLEDELHVTRTRAESAGRSNQLMALGTERLGLQGQATLRYEADCTGSGLCQQACPSRRKQSLDLTYIPYALERGARVYATCRAEKVLHSGSRITGVAGRFRHPETGERGPRLQVEARKGVIVAASAVQSPALLARSGFGGSRVGRNFRAHPGSGVAGVYDEVVRPWEGATQGYEVLSLRDQGAKLESLMMPPELISVRLPGVGTDYLRSMKEIPHLAVWGSAVLADAEGRVWNTPFGPKVAYTPTGEDVARLRLAFKTIAAMHFAAGAKAVLPFIYGLPERLTDPAELRLFDDAPLDPRAYSMIISHVFGTCAMGRDPQGSVVGPDFRVHGTDNLYVADASVFPDNIGVNPQHTIMALAVICARGLVDGKRQRHPVSRLG